MMILTQLLGIFILGLIGGANPGPILASSFAETLKNGFGKSLQLVLKALIAETIVAIVVLTLFFSINIPPKVFYVISFIGSGVLIWIASQIWKIKSLEENKTIFSFKKIFYLTVFNGPFWIFWITVCVPQAFLLKEKIWGGQFLFLIFFELGWLVATVLFNFIFSKFKTILVKGNLTSIIFKILALILVFFAIKLTIQSIFSLLN